MREQDATAGRDDDGRQPVADRDFDVSPSLLQLLDVYLGLALAADVHERHLRAEADDDAFDCLAALETARLDGGFEHRCEIFLIAHWRAPGWRKDFNYRGRGPG